MPRTLVAGPIRPRWPAQFMKRWNVGPHSLYGPMWRMNATRKGTTFSMRTSCVGVAVLTLASPAGDPGPGAPGRPVRNCDGADPNTCRNARLNASCVSYPASNANLGDRALGGLQRQGRRLQPQPAHVLVDPFAHQA